jgi:hypothetical protein
MKTLTIYDPAMCCSTGVCGPNPDEKLVQLASFIKGLDKNTYSVERYNLAQQPEAYTASQVVAKALKEKGADALPLIFIDDEMVCSGKYPSVDELAGLINLDCTETPQDSSCCSGKCCE